MLDSYSKQVKKALDNAFTTGFLAGVTFTSIIWMMGYYIHILP